MNPLVFLAVVIAGGVGAAVRYLVDVAVRRRTGERFPWGILVVNLTGALALGLVTPLAADEAWRWIIGTGLLGGYTTFSAVAVTTALLAEEGRTRTSVAYAVASFVGSVIAAAIGLSVGSLL
ncbi:fluoride efflux transporter CrcB [Microbacterium testaceum]|uniref:Fluoride-specific ion channel FluC n=1 Tax=Microbacterium testaceum TaxID=2033 RepID=A0A2T7WLE8_MICTE|nr:fluoride efflux transporter CrcB [Microbacterium testaceum]PVE75391.1 fluoride efflux transporter CrcB [Microbacterium testaceum]